MLTAAQFGRKKKIWLASVFIVPCSLAQIAPVGEGRNPEKQPQAAQVSVRLEYVPMTQNERLRYYFQHTFSAESVVRSAAAAGINHALNTPGEWGQGVEGYGRRFASSYGGHIIQATVMYGTSAVLREDNRYFRCEQTGGGARLKYALASSFLARRDDGTRHLSFSRLGSYAAAAAISRAWQPSSTRGAGNALNAFVIAVGVEAGFNVAREFLPRIFHTRNPVAVSKTPAN